MMMRQPARIRPGGLRALGTLNLAMPDGVYLDLLSVAIADGCVSGISFLPFGSIGAGPT